MLRLAAFALTSSVAFALPQVSVAQTVGLVQEPVVLVQETIVAAPRTVVTNTARTSSCYTPSVDGPSNVGALPLCSDYLEQAAGGEQYETIDRMALADTQVCASGVNCGPPADLTNIQPFYGSSATATPPPPPAPVPTFVAPPVTAPPVITPPPAPVFAPVPAAPLPAAGLGGIGLAAAGVAGIAAIVGVIALVSDDDDDDNAAVGTR